MNYALYAALWVFKRGPIGLGIFALLILALGFLGQKLDNERQARHAVALETGPPAPVRIDTLTADNRPAQDTAVVLQAQLLSDDAYDLWYEGQIGMDFVVMFPLVGAKDTNSDTVLGVAIFQAEDDSWATLSEQRAEDWTVTQGALGPVMNLNGELDDMGKWNDLIDDAFYDQGLNMPEKPHRDLALR